MRITWLETSETAAEPKPHESPAGNEIAQPGAITSGGARPAAGVLIRPLTQEESDRASTARSRFADCGGARLTYSPTGSGLSAAAALRSRRSDSPTRREKVP